MLGRLIIDDVRPRTPGGYPAKALVGDRITVSADVFREGHDLLAARVRWRAVGGGWGAARRRRLVGRADGPRRQRPVDRRDGRGGGRPPRGAGRGVDRPVRDVAP